MYPLAHLLVLPALLLSTSVGAANSRRSHSDTANGHQSLHRRLDLSGRASSSGVVGPQSDLHIVNAQVAPDGFSRSAVLANGQFPGPLITGYRGQYFSLNVINDLTDNTMRMSTSIHWHGFFQKGRTWVDGPAFVSQCPIAPGHSFKYDFTAFDQPGTYWYHSHLSTQYCDGLRGAFVVYDLLDPYQFMYDVDNADTVITLADWYHTVAPDLYIGESVATLINGKGRYQGGPKVDLAVISVKRNVRYRMRLVSISCDPNWVFSIDKHTMTIIEVDGTAHKPNTVDSIQIFAGQRYSFILTANQAVGNYWIRANPNVGTTGFDGGMNSAILRYAGAPAQEPTTALVTSKDPLIESELVPLNIFNRAAPGRPVVDGADVNINLDIVFDMGTFKFTVNGKTFVHPTIPVLLQILSGAKTAQELLPEGSLFQIPPNKVVQLSFPAGAIGGPHPIHLHGHIFSVVRAAGQKGYNFANPPQRDVVSMGGPGDNVTIRFTTDNAGPWFLHCHIDWHMELGLAVVFAENTGQTAMLNSPSQAWKDLCPIYNALPSGQQ